MLRRPVETTVKTEVSALPSYGSQVALLVTLAPYRQDPVPANVMRAINYYQSAGWGAPLTAGPGFRGKLSNVDVAEDSTVSHINIDKSARIQAEIAREIGAVAKGK